MYIEYKNERLKRILNSCSKLVQEYGADNARKVVQRLNEISAVTSVGMLVQHRIGRCHALKGDYAGMFAMDLSGGWRLLFRPVLGPSETLAEADLFTVEIVCIMEVTDYHD